MKIAIGSDHAGYSLKSHPSGYLAAAGNQVVDVGTDSNESVDYPPFCAAVGRLVTIGEADRGIVLGGSGHGEQIAANKGQGSSGRLVPGLLHRRNVPSPQ